MRMKNQPTSAVWTGIHLLVITLLCIPLFCPGQAKDSGSPEKNLPRHITQLTGFGERAAWSPDDEPAGVGHGIFLYKLK